MLFHAATGLAQCEKRVRVVREEAWGAVIRKMPQAGAPSRADTEGKGVRFGERTFVERCDEIDKMGDDPAARSAAVWRALSAKKANVAMVKLFPLDELSNALVTVEDEAFLGVAGGIGTKSVQKLDGRSVLPAFEAWCKVFQIEFEAVRGADGGDWLLGKELTFELFCKVLARMPSGKAVGEPRVVFLSSCSGRPSRRWWSCSTMRWCPTWGLVADAMRWVDKGANSR